MLPTPDDFQRVFEQLPVAALLVSADGRFTILGVSDALLRGADVRRNELVGRDLLELYPDDELRASMQRAIDTRAPQRLAARKRPLPVQRDRSEERAWWATQTPVMGENGNVVSLLLELETLPDSTDIPRAVEDERERLTAESAAARAELEAIFQSFPDALYVGDATGIQRANAAALEQLGYDDVDELNHHIGELAAQIQTRRFDTGEPIPGEEQAFTHALQGHADVQEVIVRHLKTGEDRVVRSSCAPIRVDGRVVGAVAINTDITARKRDERSLRERAEFEQQLIGIVSHDLRNPLQGILLGAQGLLRREGLDDRTVRTLLRVQASADRAARLVNDLLDFTRARLGGGIPIVVRQVNLSEVARQVVDELRMAYADRTLLLEAEGDVTGCWDPDRLNQVVSNLATNAVKYSPADTPVRIDIRAQGDDVVLSVNNLGEPIPPEAQSRLFRPLTRGTADMDPASRSVGLGLYIVEHLVRAHGGTISVTSSREQGTTFFVRLPRRGPAAEANAAGR